MIDPFPASDRPPIQAFDDGHRPPPATATALLRECTAHFEDEIGRAAGVVVDVSEDLFQSGPQPSGATLAHFLAARSDWLARFRRALHDALAQRLAGVRRKGRRPDADTSLVTLAVLSARDQERQSAIIRAASALRLAVQGEIGALDLRVALLLGEDSHRDFDNPFGIDYLMDAIGATSRALFGEADVWRSLMERVLIDMKPAVVKTYVSLNRILADRGVMPDIKATLRARSTLRPDNDSELLPTFRQLLAKNRPQQASAGTGEATHGAETAPTGSPMSAVGAQQLPAATWSSAAAEAFYAAFARYAHQAPAPPGGPSHAEAAAARATVPGDHDPLAFPALDPALALGPTRAVVAALEAWQRFDPEAALSSHDPAAAAALPLNRLPLVRAALGDVVSDPIERVSIDVVSLIFDYIFRDPSIPDSTRRTLSRLQVPIAKAALIDPAFFTNRRHPARRLLDDLAAAAVGANGDAGYDQRFAALAEEVVDGIVSDFGVDMAAFDAAGERLRPLIESDHAATAEGLEDDIGAALAAERGDADGATVRSVLRDKLAGIDVPADVRNFVETLWFAHLSAVRARDGAQSPAWNEALATLDDLLWSIAAKERSAQRARLTKLIPSLVRRLRAGVASLPDADGHLRVFFEALYELHMAALRPAPKPAHPRAPGASSHRPAADAAVPEQMPQPANPYDFVGEMAVGTWLRFNLPEGPLPVRLFWVSPLRTRYVFTSRGRGKAFSFTPEEVAWQLATGRAALIVEPVPVFDRAVSAALDALGASLEPATAA